jgi:hypothetical protein
MKVTDGNGCFDLKVSLLLPSHMLSHCDQHMVPSTFLPEKHNQGKKKTQRAVSSTPCKVSHFSAPSGTRHNALFKLVIRFGTSSIGLLVVGNKVSSVVPQARMHQGVRDSLHEPLFAVLMTFLPTSLARIATAPHSLHFKKYRMRSMNHENLCDRISRPVTKSRRVPWDVLKSCLTCISPLAAMKEMG